MDTSWTTEKEINFINKLGTFSKIKKPHEQWARNYWATIKGRKDWGSMDKYLIMSHVDRLIRK